MAKVVPAAMRARHQSGTARIRSVYENWASAADSGTNCRRKESDLRVGQGGSVVEQVLARSDTSLNQTQGANGVRDRRQSSHCAAGNGSASGGCIGGLRAGERECTGRGSGGSGEVVDALDGDSSACRVSDGIDPERGGLGVDLRQR